MSVAEDPLVTRSLPTGWWRHFPEALKQWDHELQQAAVDFSRDHPDFWSFIRFATEERSGIALFTAIVIVGSIVWLRFDLARARRMQPPPVEARTSARETAARIRQRGLALLAVLLGLGVSDLSASALKTLVGRLKPHVDFYNPNYQPALSLPSNHATNTAFLFVALLLLMPRERRRTHRFFFVAFAVLICAVGATRVLLGQHYPVDVASGFAVGAVLGAVWVRAYRWISELVARRASRRTSDRKK